jgi:hypothetical protein
MSGTPATGPGAREGYPMSIAVPRGTPVTDHSLTSGSASKAGLLVQSGGFP